jgi:PAT family beta-lactamase induction signal transducer AmpG
MTLRRKLWWVAVLYFAEGMPFGLVKDVVPVWMRVGGASLETVGLISLAGYPWTFKFLWSPLIDRFGQRRDWISGCLLMLAAVSAVFSTLDPSISMGAIWYALLALAFASATQDIAIDAYTIGLVDRGEEGKANGVRVAAARVALITSGGALLLIVPWIGWPTAYLLAAAVFVVLAVVARAAPPVVVNAAAQRDWRPLLNWATRRGAPAMFAFALIYKLGDASMGPMVRPFWIDKGFSVFEIGLISTTLGILLTIAGALVGGRLTDRWGLLPALFFLGLAQALSNLGYAGVAWLGLPPPTIEVKSLADVLGAIAQPARFLMYGASMLESFTGGLGTAAFMSLLMRVCDRDHAAVQYAVLSALFAFSRDTVGAASGFGVKQLGYASYFTLTFLLSFPALALLPWLRPLVQEPQPRS